MAVLAIVHGRSGIRGSELMALLATEFIGWEPLQLRAIPAELVRAQELVEIEYMLPNQIKSDSFFLPAGSMIMGYSHGKL